MQEYPLVTVVCPVYNEEKFIVGCVESILKQDYPHNCLEVFFVDGMSNDCTRELLSPYIRQYPFIHLLDNPKRTAPCAMNVGIKASNGEVIVRMDAHAEYVYNYVSVLVKYLYELGADNVGAVCNTLPAKNTATCIAIAYAGSHPFGVGDSKFRIGAKKIQRVDTVPFGCYRRIVFERIGLFDEDLVRNQDDEFNARLINAGGKIFLIPGLVINYMARDNISKMIKMYYQYGLFKPLVNKKLGAPATVRQFFPALFVLGLFIGLFLSFVSSFLLFLYVAIIILYVVIALSIAFVASLQKKNWKLFFILPYVFFVIHCSYGIGYMHGILKLFLKKDFIVNSNR